jgi:hypothetical protein
VVLEFRIEGRMRSKFWASGFPDISNNSFGLGIVAFVVLDLLLCSIYSKQGLSKLCSIIIITQVLKYLGVFLIKL